MAHVLPKKWTCSTNRQEIRPNTSLLPPRVPSVPSLLSLTSETSCPSPFISSLFIHIFHPISFFRPSHLHSSFHPRPFPPPAQIHQHTANNKRSGGNKVTPSDPHYSSSFPPSLISKPDWETKKATSSLKMGVLLSRKSEASSTITGSSVNSSTIRRVWREQEYVCVSVVRGCVRKNYSLNNAINDMMYSHGTVVAGATGYEDESPAASDHPDVVLQTSQHDCKDTDNVSSGIWWCHWCASRKTQDACQHCLVLDHSRTPSWLATLATDAQQAGIPGQGRSIIHVSGEYFHACTGCTGPHSRGWATELQTQAARYLISTAYEFDSEYQVSRLVWIISSHALAHRSGVPLHSSYRTLPLIVLMTLSGCSNISFCMK